MLPAIMAAVIAVVVDGLPGGGCGDPKAGPVLRGIDLVALYNNPTKAPINGTFSDDALGGYVFRFSTQVSSISLLSCLSRLVATTQANLDTFRANRSKFTPGFGGFRHLSLYCRIASPH